jgi:hypothetical protein
LAGGTSDEALNRSACCGSFEERLIGHISEVGCIGPVVVEDGAWERLYLAYPSAVPAEGFPSEGGGFDA